MGKPKIAYDKVNETFEKEGYILLTKVWKNIKVPLQTICPNGHDYKARYDDFKRGVRCVECRGLKKKTIDFVRAFFEIEGYQLLSDTYVNSITPLHAKCPEGHEGFPTYGNFQQGLRCLECAGHKKKTIEEVRLFFEKEGYRLISDVYEANDSHLHSICPKNHDYFVSFSKFQDGKRCMECSGSRKKTLEEARSIFEEHSYKIISLEYKNSSTPLETKCPRGHEYWTSLSNFKTGYRCSICQHSGISKMELELMDSVRVFVPHLVSKFFNVSIVGKPHIKRFQVDGYDPKTKLGIEFDGTYYHSEEYLIESKTSVGWTVEEAANYHEIKDSSLRDCHGISIIHIKEEDWLVDKQACINKCLEFLGVAQKKVA
jgi:hypothetical protein